LTVSRSVAASMIRSQSQKVGSVVVVRMRASAAALSSAVILPRETWRSMFFSISASALSSAA
jgi:hypothetical protein